MLKGLFSTKQSILPPPPKNQIEVACPACGAAQYEPRLVVSTFCKSCGVHLSVHKRKVTASTVTRSGAVGVNDLWDKAAPPRRTAAEPDSPEPQAVGTSVQPSPALESEPPSQAAPVSNPPERDDAAAPPEAEAPDLAGMTAEEAALTGFGAFLQAASTLPGGLRRIEAQSPARPDPKPQPKPAIVLPEPPVPSTPAPPPNSTLERMKSQSVYRQQYFKDIECFECRHVFKVSRSMKSAECTACGAAICIEDFDINQRVTQPVRTRGDVIIRKPGHVAADFIECRDLRCLGLIEATVRCQNEATFRTEGTIKGEINCRKLTVEKGADITFLNPVRAGDMHINSRVTGALNATGKIVIGPYGSVNGDVTARAVAIEPGGELNGGMNIVRAAPVPAPAPDPAPPAEPPDV